MTLPTWLYKIMKADLLAGNFVYKMFGVKFISNPFAKRLESMDNDIKQGKEPQFRMPLFSIAMLTLITLGIIFRKKIKSFIKKLFKL